MVDFYDIPEHSITEVLNIFSEYCQITEYQDNIIIVDMITDVEDIDAFMYAVVYTLKKYNIGLNYTIIINDLCTIRCIDKEYDYAYE